ncbi:MAG: hypothetical protein HXY22_04195 [Alphaproteobacteria bacterium]|nr:hypothetical protein [Alphaproteobacteria bacterium]
MMDQPSSLEMIAAVREFLETRVLPALEGHTAFHARVAINVLGIIARELEQYPAALEEERRRLEAILGHPGPIEGLARELCLKLRDGSLGLESPGVAEHLRLSTIAKVAIDQPLYSGLKTALTP